MSKFIYFPSFSAGEYGDKLKKDFRFRNGMTCRFYSDEMEEKYRHPQVLITAGAHFKTDNYREALGLTKDNLVMGDSGGYQIASGAMKWDIKHRDRIFNWLEENTDIAMNLDIPPRLKYEGKFQECLDISKENFQYFSDNMSGKTKFLNVVQGDDEYTYMHWYNQVKHFEFNGWGIGGCGGSLYRFMSGLNALLSGKEHLKDSTKVIHILGTSKIRDFLMLSQLAKSLSDVGSKAIITTDSSSPDRAVVFGTFVTDFSLKKGSFESINFPNEKHQGEKVMKEFTELDSQIWPRITDFDDKLAETVSWDDVVNWNADCTIGMRMHNFYLYKDAIQLIEHYINGHDYILEQVVDRDVYKVLKSIDEMVKADDSTKVFEKYKHLYKDMSNVKKSETYSTGKFF
tara:strand:+ start:394 stop:1593 length:1200 start_codon:yes stop_codon:yes gene_type:complete